MFVSKEAVEVTEGENVILIRPKMDYGTRSRVMGAAVQIEAGASTGEVNVGAYQLALLTHNVLGWRGPAFEGVKCTPENVARLDPDEPLVARALEEIAARNAPGKAPPSAPNGGSGSSAVLEVASPSVNGTSK